MATAVEPIWEQWTRDTIIPSKLLTVADWWALLAHRPYTVPVVGGVAQVPPVWGSVANAGNIVDWMAMKLSDDEGLAIAEYQDGTNGLYLLTLASFVQPTTPLGSIGASWQLITSGVTASVADGSITTAKLADSAVTSVKIADGTIQTVDLSPGCVTTPILADGAVTSVKIADGGIQTVDLAPGSVTTPIIQDGAVTSAKIPVGAVTTTQIADGTIQTADIAPGAVGTNQIAVGAITTPLIAPGAVGTAQLAPLSVTNAQLAPGSVTSGNIADGAVQTTDIADHSIIEAKLALNSVGTPELITAAVTTPKICNAPNGVIDAHIQSVSWSKLTGVPTDFRATVRIGPTPPAMSQPGDLWWRNDPDGTLYVYYDDGNSQQFVPATPSVTPTGGLSQTLGYRHVQATASTVWAITHPLSFWPNVSVVDSTGREVWPDTVDYPSATTVQITFSAALGGEAYLS
jgi:hypothetical protein